MDKKCARTHKKSVFEHIFYGQTLVFIYLLNYEEVHHKGYC